MAEKPVKAVKAFVAGPEDREPTDAEAVAMAEALWAQIARPEDLDAEDDQADLSTSS